MGNQLEAIFWDNASLEARALFNRNTVSISDEQGLDALWEGAK
jgi:hypothetical protein